MNRHLIILVILALHQSLTSPAAAQTPRPETRTDRPDTLATTRQQALVVTGTRTEKLLAETPVRTELITPADMAAIGARTLAEAVEFTPGLRVLNSCQNCNFTELSILGLEGKYTQVHGLEHIPARLIDRIEVIKGGGSAVYGPGAVAGVINVIPRLPLDSGGSASIQYEDMDGSPGWSAGFTADVVSRDGRTAATFFGQGERLDPYDRNGDGFTEIGRRASNATGLRVLRETAGDGRLTVDFSRLYEDRRGGDQLDRPPFDSEVAEWARTWRNAASLGWRQPWSANFETQFTVAYAHTERSTYYGGGGDTEAYGETWNPVWIADLQANRHVGRRTLTVGVQASHEDLSDLYPGYDRLIDERYTNLGLYVQDDWALTVAARRAAPGVQPPRVAARRSLAGIPGAADLRRGHARGDRRR